MASKTKKTSKTKPAAKSKTVVKPKVTKPKTAGKTKTVQPAAQPKTGSKPKPDTLSPKNVTKTLNIMAALSSDKGVTIDEMTKLTGWLPHTARAYLSGVRKKLVKKNDGSRIIKYTQDGKTMYKIEIVQDGNE